MVRRGTNRILFAYVLLVILGGSIALATHLPPWPDRTISAGEFLTFLAIATVLDLMVVPLANGGGVSASFAIYFGGLIALGAAPSAWAAAIAGLGADGLLRRRSFVKTAFNASHSILSLLVAGVVYEQLGGRVGSVSPEKLIAVVSAAAVLWLLETMWMALVITLERGGKAWSRFSASLRPMLALDAALASVGLLLALLYQEFNHMLRQSSQGMFFLAAVATIPSGLLYYAYRLQGHLRQTYAMSLQALGSLVEAKLQHSQPSHGRQVAQLATALAQALELPATHVEQIRYAGYLHDIGKIGVPAHLLHRSRDAFEGEASQVRFHAEIGQQILAPIHFLQPAAEMVRAHHERWDGLGYPNRLQGTSIPLGARILTLADAYQGLTEGYGQAPITPQQAMQRLRQSAGSRFDPDLIDVLEHLLRTQGQFASETASSLSYAGAPTP